LTGRQKSLALLVGVVLLVSVTALIFGPARGAREDIGHVRKDLNASRTGIYQTRDTLAATLQGITAQLQTTQQSLEIQQQGLTVARDTQRITQTATDNTEAIRAQTASTLDMVRQVLAALAPLQKLPEDIDSITDNIQTAVSLARTALDVGQQTLSTGRQALAIATSTLDTLRQSRDIQAQLLATARQTLEQTRQINAKLPLVPVFPTQAPVAATQAAEATPAPVPSRAATQR
jgi:chromosome segregation ATPase